MNIDKIIEDVTGEIKKSSGENYQVLGSQNFTGPNFAPDESPLPGSKKTIEDLKTGGHIEDIETQTQIYMILHDDIKKIVSDYLLTCEDGNAAKGMQKCYLETWQACCNYIGLHYFIPSRVMFDHVREKKEGGKRLHDIMIDIGIEVYEDFCNMYRKQFFIYDCCRFLGINKDMMFALNDKHARALKKAHASQESSMRSALASGRSNVTAMAILLNHDYDYTRTTQIIHTSSNEGIKADSLPTLSQTQDIVYEGERLPGEIGKNGM